MPDDTARRIALLLKALDDLAEEKADFNEKWGERRQEIIEHLNRLRYDVLSGQHALPLEPEPEAVNGQNSLNN